MAIYLQDGGTNGHSTWCDEAIRAGVADAAIVSPFFTPKTPRKGHKTGTEFVELVVEAGGSVVFDATTHGATLRGANNWTSYNTWKLWGGPRGDLSSTSLIERHVELVLGTQDELGVPRLVPSVSLDSPSGADSEVALELAEHGARLDAGAWQTLAGRRGFWLSDELDAYVGSLQQLRAPVWFITLVHDQGDYPPAISEPEQLVALCRTVDSLSRRSDVVVCHSDLLGLPAIAAGASGIGTGWHGKQRVCAPSTFQTNDPLAIRRNAIWQTYQGLLARLHVNESRIFFERDSSRASAWFPGTPVDTAAGSRLHHLLALRNAVMDLLQFASKADRAERLKDLYEESAGRLDDLARLYGAAFARQRVAHIDGLADVLGAYGRGEKFWD